jgi:hypothetical protein
VDLGTDPEAIPYQDVLFFHKRYNGRDLTRCTDLNGNGADELALLGERYQDALKVIIKDARMKELIGVVNF